jgi:aspartyl-tRNA(Asn)/glutamyl-tRNA(Gln) amidotransferase subunit A
MTIFQKECPESKIVMFPIGDHARRQRPQRRMGDAMNTQWMDATETAEQIRGGRLTSREAVRQALDRIAALDCQLHAFALVLRDEALATAVLRDRERAAGLIRGHLHGVPVAVKDLFDIAGHRTGAGSLNFPDHVAAVSASAVLKLEAAGAVIVGKTQMVEFAFGGWGTNPVLGAPRNPYDLRHSHRAAGGSSSGSAVAVASGMVPLALGTDTGGSVRIPAAFCGVFGHKSSPDLIARDGMRFLSPSHDTIGALARSARDLDLAALLLADGQGLGDALPTGNALRLATLDDEAMALLDSEVRITFERALAGLERQYGRIERIGLPVPMVEMCDKAGRLMSAESYASLREITEDRTTQIASAIRARINRGRDINAAELASLHALKAQWKAAFAACFAPFDLLVMPGAALLPPPIESIDEADMRPSIFGRFVNMLDLCACSVPVALSQDGLPIGLQLIGRVGADRLALHLGTAMERRGLAAFRRPDLEAAAGPERCAGGGSE